MRNSLRQWQTGFGFFRLGGTRVCQIRTRRGEQVYWHETASAEIGASGRNADLIFSTCRIRLFKSIPFEGRRFHLGEAQALFSPGAEFVLCRKSVQFVGSRGTSTNFGNEGNSLDEFEAPFGYPVPTKRQREEEIRQRAIKDAREAFAEISEMPKDDGKSFK